MRKRVSVVLRLFVMLVMALGLATLMASPAAAQQTVQCQTIIDGEIDQQDCVVTVTGDGQCQVVLESGEIQQNIACSPEGCPQQLIDDDGNIFQFQCTGGPTATNAPATATNVPATATNVPATNVPATNVPGTNVPATDVPDVPATDVPDVPDVPEDEDEDVDTGGQAEEEMEVSVLPDTGQGPDAGQSNSATMLLLGAMATVMTLGAVALRLRRNG